MRDAASGKSRGFGFVTFASSFMTEAAMDAAPFEICGVKVSKVFHSTIRRFLSKLLSNSESLFNIN